MRLSKLTKDKLKKYNIDVPIDRRTKEFKNYLAESGLTVEEYRITIREVVKFYDNEYKEKNGRIKKLYEEIRDELEDLKKSGVKKTIDINRLYDIPNIKSEDYKSFIIRILKTAKKFNNDKQRIVFQINPTEDDEKTNNYYTLNDNFYNLIDSPIFSNIFGVKSGEDVDYYISNGFEDRAIEYLEFNSIERINKNNRIEGAFFPYYCQSMDLKRYQIFKDQFEADLTDNCLVYALRLLGMEEYKLDIIKTFVSNGYVNKARLKDITEKLKIKINLYEERNDVTANKTRNTTYGKDYKEVYKIALYDSHYFIYENFNGETTLNLIKRLSENEEKFLIPFDYNNIDIKNTSVSYSGCLEYNENAIKDKIFKEKTASKDEKLIFIDFETYTINKKDKLIHKPYLLCIQYDKTEEKRAFIGEDCSRQFINFLNNRNDKFITLIAHNAKYDFNFIVRELRITKEINSEGHFKQLTGYTTKGIRINIKCSMNMFNLALKDCPKAFMDEDEQKFIKKEVMPYKLYNIDGNVTKRDIEIKDIKKEHFNKNSSEELEEFIENAKNWNCYDDLYNTIDIIKYSRIYCEMDVLILSKCYNRFKQWVQDDFSLNIDNYLTISSIADAYFSKKDCYKDVKQIGLNVQQFIMKSVYGGRVMTRRNEKIFIEDIINDFDAVSLYPSAMERLKYPKGTPKIITNKTMEFLQTTDAYFVEIRVLKVGKNRDFPILSTYEDGIRNYTNDMINRVIVVNNITLEDLIKYHKIEFEIIQGYYYNDGFNDNIIDVIRYLFNKRAELKKDGNKAEIIYKLLMNSAYGKTIQKPHMEDYDFIYGDMNLYSYVSKNYNSVINYRKFDDKCYKIKKSKPANDHFNLAHIGSLILSMSKRIMNEVMTLAEDNNIDIYYQDTDSMHLKDCDIPKLEQIFKKTYDRDLIGKKLGQFHSDFEIKKAPKGTSIYSKKLIALGKKCYIDVLEGVDTKGNIYNDYHIRLKGVSKDAIEYEAKKKNKSVVDIYEQLFNGESITFDLTCGGNKTTCFKFSKKFTVETQQDFKRTIKF